MQETIFEIAFELEGKRYRGWVTPSGELSDEGRPLSFYIVLEKASFGYITYRNCTWIANEERPEQMVNKIGEEIEKHYSLNDSSMDDKTKKDSSQHGGITDKQDKNAGSGGFNRGSEDDPHMNDGVADGTPDPDKVSKEKENPRSGKQA